MEKFDDIKKSIEATLEYSVKLENNNEIKINKNYLTLVVREKSKLNDIKNELKKESIKKNKEIQNKYNEIISPLLEKEIYFKNKIKQITLDKELRIDPTKNYKDFDKNINEIKNNLTVINNINNELKNKNNEIYNNEINALINCDIRKESDIITKYIKVEILNNKLKKMILNLNKEISTEFKIKKNE